MWWVAGKHLLLLAYIYGYVQQRVICKAALEDSGGDHGGRSGSSTTPEWRQRATVSSLFESEPVLFDTNSTHAQVLVCCVSPKNIKPVFFNPLFLLIGSQAHNSCTALALDLGREGSARYLKNQPQLESLKQQSYLIMRRKPAQFFIGS